MTNSVIRMSDLSRDFGDVKAVDHLSLDVPNGIIFGFLGPNGAGKTTTIRMLLGLIEPSGGTIEVLGYDTQNHSEAIRSSTGALLERNGLYVRLSAVENLEFYGRVYRLRSSERNTRIRELLERMGLWHRRDEPVGKWSLGMRKKLALARAMLHRPPLLLLDEPTAGLDLMAAIEVRKTLATLATHDGATIFLTTHNLNEAEQLCSRIAVIKRGQLIAVGPPDGLQDHSGDSYTKITCKIASDAVLQKVSALPEICSVRTSGNSLEIHVHCDLDISHILSTLVEMGIKVTGVSSQKISLEDVFLALIKDGDK